MIDQVKQREAELRGEERGRAEGERNKAVEMAKKMIQENFPADLIAELCELPLPEVETLKNNSQA